MKLVIANFVILYFCLTVSVVKQSSNFYFILKLKCHYFVSFLFTVKERELSFFSPLAIFSFHLGNSCNFQTHKRLSNIACSQQTTFLISLQIFPIKYLIIKDSRQYNLLFVIINSPLLFLQSEISLIELSVI